LLRLEGVLPRLIVPSHFAERDANQIASALSDFNFDGSLECSAEDVRIQPEIAAALMRVRTLSPPGPRLPIFVQRPGPVPRSASQTAPSVTFRHVQAFGSRIRLGGVERATNRGAGGGRKGFGDWSHADMKRRRCRLKRRRTFRSLGRKGNVGGKKRFSSWKNFRRGGGVRRQKSAGPFESNAGRPALWSARTS